MESSQHMQRQSMGQSSFFYYNPEPNADHRQHGHFSPHPNAAQDSMPLHPYQQQHYYQDTAAYQGQQSTMYPFLPSSGPPMFPQQKPAMTMASPRPLQQKPAFLYQYEGHHLSLDTGCNTPDVYVYPSTPPLSSSGSISSSSSPPASCSILPTPVNESSIGLENMKVIKEGCEGDVQSEILAGGDWTRCCSPPLTPGMSPLHIYLLYRLKTWLGFQIWQSACYPCVTIALVKIPRLIVLSRP